jgi:ADP-ribose pyrophosphatase YjhB (NUDIX family)
MERRLAVRGIIYEKGKIFAVRLKPYRHTDSLTYFCTPGGGLDPHEAFIPALKREILEEVGVAAFIGRLLFVQQFVHKEQEQIEFFFHIENTEDFKEIDLAKTSHGVEEIAEYGFYNPNEITLLPKFLSEINIGDHIAGNLPTQFFDYLL